MELSSETISRMYMEICTKKNEQIAKNRDLPGLDYKISRSKYGYLLFITEQLTFISGSSEISDQTNQIHIFSYFKVWKKVGTEILCYFNALIQQSTNNDKTRCNDM